MAKNKRLLIVLCAWVLGAALVVYPVVATMINNNAHNQTVDRFLQKQSQGARANSGDSVDEQLRQAEAYNRRGNLGPILDPLLPGVAPDSKEYRAYLKLLNFNGLMGVVAIPKIEVKLPIYHGTFEDSLAKGVGHLYGSSLPVGGKSTKAILTAHSGLGTATMFDRLPELKIGDPIFLQVGTRKMKYKMIGSLVVTPQQVDSLRLEPNRDLIVLVTCTPYGVNTHRLLVTAERVPLDAKEAAHAFSYNPSPWRWWMGASLILLLFWVLLFVYLITRRLRGKPLPGTNWWANRQVSGQEGGSQDT